MIFEFNEEKSLLLEKARGVGFEDVVKAIRDGKVLDDVKHPSKKYPHQRILLVAIGDYIFVVPYIKKGEGVLFLKTLYPSRRFTKSFKKTNK